MSDLTISPTSLFIGQPVVSGTSGSVLFVDSNVNLAQDNSNFFWDNSNNRVGIGTAAPSAKLEIMNGAATDISLILQGAASQSVDFLRLQNSSGTNLLIADSRASLKILPEAVTFTSGFTPITSPAANITLNFSSASMAVLSHNSNVIFQQSGNGFLSMALFANLSTVTNLSSVAASFGAMNTFYDFPTITADTQTGLTGAYTTLTSSPFFQTTNGGTATISALNHIFISNGTTIGSGITVTVRRGIYIRNPSISGTVTTNTALEIDDVSGGGTNISLRVKGTTGHSRHQPVIHFGSDSAPTGQADVTIGSSSRVGVIVNAAASQSADLINLKDSSGNILSGFDSSGNLELLSTAITAGGSNLISTPAVTYTGNAAALYNFVRSQHTLSYTAAQNIFTGSFFFYASHTIKNAASLTGSMGNTAIYANQVALQADTNAITADHYNVFYDIGTVSRINAGTLALTSYNSFHANPGTVGAGCTVTDHRGVWIQNPANSGTITTNTRLEIDDVATGTTKLAIRVKGTSGVSRHQPKIRFGSDADPSTDVHITGGLATGRSTVSLTADNQVVTVSNLSYIALSSDNAVAANRTFVLTQGSVAGHLLVLEWVGTNAGELVDDSAVNGGGNHRLSATWLPTQYDILELIWNGTDWVERNRSLN